jgi:O-antigen ligase
MNSFINKLNIFTWLFLAIVVVVFLYAFSADVKYAAYLALGTGFIVFVSKVSTVNIQLPVILVAIIFVHSVLIFESKINFLVIDVPILLVIISLIVNRYAYNITIPINEIQKLFIGLIILSAVISFAFSLLEGSSIEYQIDVFQNRIIWLILYFIFGLQISVYSQWGKIEWLSIIVLLLGIMQFYALTTGTNLEAVRDDVVVSAVRDVEKNWRYGGVFGNPNTLSAFLICCIPFSVRGVIESNNMPLVVLYILSLVISLFSVLTTGSRTGLMLFLPALVVSYVYLSLQSSKTDGGRLLNYVKIVIGILLVGVIYYLYPVEFDMQLIENTFERYTSQNNATEDVRFDLWRCTLEKGIPFSPGGMGLGYGESSLFAQFVATECQDVKEALVNPHNIFLEVFVNLGILGGGLFIIILVKVFGFGSHSKMMRKMKSAEFLFIFLFFLYGMSEPLLFSAKKINWVFAIVLGIFFARNSLRIK